MKRPFPYGPHVRGVDQRSRLQVLPPRNPWKPGDRVRFRPIADQVADPDVYIVRAVGTFIRTPCVWLEGRDKDYPSALFEASDEPPPAADPILVAARAAWRAKRAAETALRNLRKYQNVTDAMKRDRQRAYERLERAEEDLHRLLGGAS